MKKRLLTACILSLFVAVVADAQEAPITTVTFRVVDEAGRPLSNAVVRGTSYWSHARRIGSTDTNGVYAYLDRVDAEVGCTVLKEGYYKSRGDIWHRSRIGDHPTNTLTVILKRIVDPVPMLHRRVEAIFPRLNELVGYDLEVGDWVAPDGKGRTADMLLKAEKRWESRVDFDFTVSVSFPNAGDGIVPFVAKDPSGTELASDLMPPHQAPAEGYATNIVAFVAMRPKTLPPESWTPDKNYIFRVRTQKDATGNVVNANVGWLNGDFKVGPTTDRLGLIMFNYYYNPDPHSRSLEPKDIADRQGK